jgi:hypothetical protein
MRRLNYTTGMRNLICFIALQWICSCQNNAKYLITEIQPPVDFIKDSLTYQRKFSVINAIAAHPTLDCGGIGFGGVTSDQFKRYQWLSEYASDSLLLRLCEDSSVNVRAYAAQALIERKSVFVKQIMEKSIGDTAQVSIYCGCMIVNSRLDEYIRQVYLR